MGSAAEGWAEQARYDLDTARAMLASGRYLYVLFCSQQAVEKMLKAIIAKRSRRLPPRLHQLVRLADAAGLELSPERAEFLRELSAYYVQTRYPEEIADPEIRRSQETARQVLSRTEELTQWLESIL